MDEIAGGLHSLLTFAVIILLGFFLLSLGKVQNVWKTGHSFVLESNKLSVSWPSLCMAHDG